MPRESSHHEHEAADAEAAAMARELLESARELNAWERFADWGIRLTDEGELKAPELARAFSVVRRRDFMPESYRRLHAFDNPINIGNGQTISQPRTVARMMEWLQPKRGHRVLDVGAGSGWTTALLAHVVKRDGQVVGTEAMPELVDFGRANLAKYRFPWANIYPANATLGRPEEAPYHRILVSAQMRQEWLFELAEQLNPRGGTMVTPLVSDADYGKEGFKTLLISVTRHSEEYRLALLDSRYGFVPIVRLSADASLDDEIAATQASLVY